MSTKQTGVTSRIRDILRQAGEPLSIAQILEGLPEAVERNNVSALLQQRKKAGEFAVSIIDGKPHYALVDGYTPPCPQRTPKAAKNGQPVSPPAPSRAHSAALNTGPAPVAFESPASPNPPGVAAPPHAATTAAAPETSPSTGQRFIADEASRLATSLEKVAKEMANDDISSSVMHEVIGCCALANRLAGVLWAVTP